MYFLSEGAGLFAVTHVIATMDKKGFPGCSIDGRVITCLVAGFKQGSSDVKLPG